jgi:hypothetical protein
MKKLLLILAVSVAFVQVARADLFKFGIKGGIGYSTINFDDITGIGSGQDVYNLATSDGVAAYHVGLQTRINLALLFIQPELYFKDAGGSVERVAEGGASEVFNLDMKTVDLPVLVGVKFGPLRLGVGPVGSYVLTEESIPMEINNIVEDYTVYTSGMRVGF